MNSIDQGEHDPLVGEWLRGAVDAGNPQPILASAVTAEIRRRRRVRMIAGSVAGLAGGLAVAVAIVAIAPGPMSPVRAVPAGEPVEATPVATRSGDATPVPSDDATPTPPVVEPSQSPDQASTAPAPSGKTDCQAHLSSVVPDETWTRYKLPGSGMSVSLPPGMVYSSHWGSPGQRKEQWALSAPNATSTQVGDSSRTIGVIRDNYRRPDSLALKDLGAVPCLTDVSGRPVHVGLNPSPDPAGDEIVLMVKDASGQWDFRVDFGKGVLQMSSIGGWRQLSPADHELVIAIFATVRSE